MRDWLKLAAIAAALIATATAEYELALAVGYGRWLAAAVPGALDIYTLRALRVQREVIAAILAMIAVNAVSHLVTAGLLPVSVPIVVAVSAIAPLVLWRVHVLREPAAEPQHDATEAADEELQDDDEEPEGERFRVPLRPGAAAPQQAADPVELPTVKDAVLAAAVLLGEGAKARSIVQHVAQQHGITTTEGTVRAALSRHSEELADLRAQQQAQRTGMYL